MKFKARNTKTREIREVNASMASLEKYVYDSVCPCSGPCKCRVEPDGECPNGWPSKLLAAGFI